MQFTQDHEWITVAGGIATVGITGHAQEQLGDVVFVELPDVGRTVAKGEAVGVVESVKVASDVYSPLTGEIVETNPALVDDPALVNTDPEAGAWFFRIRLADPAELEALLDADAYQALIS
jgi:glycine cleavage system H protein